MPSEDFQQVYDQAKRNYQQAQQELKESTKRFGAAYTAFNQAIDQGRGNLTDRRDAVEIAKSAVEQSERAVERAERDVERARADLLASQSSDREQVAIAASPTASSAGEVESTISIYSFINEFLVFLGGRTGVGGRQVAGGHRNLHATALPQETEVSPGNTRNVSTISDTGHLRHRHPPKDAECKVRRTSPKPT